MGHEHVAEAILVAGAERADFVGQIDDAAPRGVDLDYIGVHLVEPTDLERSAFPEEADSRWVAPPGRRPRSKGGGPCTHALPLSRRNPRPSTTGSPLSATRSCRH